MIAFFGIVAIVGILAIALDFMAMVNDPTPSMYHTGFTSLGLTMLIVGVIGAGCVFFLS